MKELRGRNAIVTGASRGIGVHIARALADRGVNLILAARTTDELETVATEMTEFGVRALAVPCDIADPLARQALVDVALSQFGSVDLLIDNAAIESTIHFQQQTDAEFDHMVDVNLLAPVALTRLVLPGMLERKRGHVVNISSLAGKAGTPYEVAYSTTKHGLMGMTRSLRGEFRDRGIGFSVICPGFVSDVGMYADSMVAHGIKAPWTLGTSKPEKVARAVIKAIEKNKPEIIVNPNATRILMTIAEASPMAGEWLLARMGVNKVFRQGAELHAAEQARAATR
ncbi:MAG: SDR family NAD(P)-dependent oxidoreductase [Chloroflexi bacterium]|nr:SDR family NAD(P)-dependent oxidoreductase [Chloroflexota bacterium]MDA1145635.1 SDR family NAD(P)-dependent oxidoreductase [Chloroflexota bacterium]